MVRADPEPGRLRLHVHLRPRRRAGSVRLPRPHAPTTTASGARRCATTTRTASTATARTASTRTATTRPSAASTRRARPTRSSRETYRGPYALSEPENLGIDRLQRRVGFEANINYHSAGQLLLTPVSYTTDYYPPDSTLFDAITGTDGDEAVFPYRSQHSSDLYESNGDTIDNAYMNYGIIGWTPEMDTCATLGEPSGCNQFASPDNESKVAGGLQQEPRVRAQRRGLDQEPRSSEELRQRPEPLPGQADPGHPAEPLRRLLRRQAGRRGHDPQGARRRRHHRQRRRPERQRDHPDDAGPRGRALRRGQGLLLRAPPGDVPATSSAPAPSRPVTSSTWSSRRAASSRSSATASRRCPTCPRPASRPRSASWSSRPRTTPASRRT